MTERTRYNGYMLLSVQTQGAVWCLLAMLVVFLAVHALRLVFLVRALLSKKPPPEKKPDPVYFIVERKKKRPKKEFSEPKEISFR